MIHRNLATLDARLQEAHNAVVGALDLLDEANTSISSDEMQAKWLLASQAGGKYIRKKDEAFPAFEDRIEAEPLVRMTDDVSIQWGTLKHALGAGRDASMQDCVKMVEGLVEANDDVADIYRLLLGTSGARPSRADALFEVLQALRDLQDEVGGYPGTQGLLPVLKEALCGAKR